MLRDQQGTELRKVDPDDREHVATLLSSPAMFSHLCKEEFRKFDANQNGVLEWSELTALASALCATVGLERPREGTLRTFFEAVDSDQDGVLNEAEFQLFFERFLRYAFLGEKKKRDHGHRKSKHDNFECSSSESWCSTPTFAGADLGTPTFFESCSREAFRSPGGRKKSQMRRSSSVPNQLDCRRGLC